MDREASQATVDQVAKSGTRLSHFQILFHFSEKIASWVKQLTVENISPNFKIFIVITSFLKPLY